MLVVRLQRTGRSGHAQFRVVVQDRRFSPTSGRVVAYLGSYNPHTKTASLKTEELSRYLEKGAQPSQRVVKLLQKEGLKLPKRTKLSKAKQREVRHPEKRRSTRPAQEEQSAAPEPPTESVEEVATEPSTETESAIETPDQEAPTPEVEAEKPAEDSKKEA